VLVARKKNGMKFDKDADSQMKVIPSIFRPQLMAQAVQAEWRGDCGQQRGHCEIEDENMEKGVHGWDVTVWKEHESHGEWKSSG